MAKKDEEKPPLVAYTIRKTIETDKQLYFKTLTETAMAQLYVLVSKGNFPAIKLALEALQPEFKPKSEVVEKVIIIPPADFTG